MTDLLDLSKPMPYRRNEHGQRLCDCPMGPCLHVAEVDGWCVACASFCRAREQR